MSAKSAIVTWTSPQPPEATVDLLECPSSLLSTLAEQKSIPSEGCVKKLLVFFPGNPGLVHFYEEFSQQLCNSGVDVIVVGFAGHSLTPHNNDRLFSLQDQVDHACQFAKFLLTDFVKKTYGSNLYVGGHSIGGFVALNVLSVFPSFKLYFGLCPVVSRIAESANGRQMFFWGVMVLQWIAAYCGSLFALLPIPLKRYVVNAKGADVNPEIRKLLAEKVHKNLLMNVFFMSMTEYRLLLRPDKPLLSCNQEKLVMYYVKKDGWCPLKHASEIKEACPRVHAYIVDEDSSIPHAWCLQHTKHVVDHAVLKYI